MTFEWGALIVFSIIVLFACVFWSLMTGKKK